MREMGTRTIISNRGDTTFMEEGSHVKDNAETEKQLSEEQRMQVNEDIFLSPPDRIVLTKHKLHLKENANPHISQYYRLGPKKSEWLEN